MSKSIDEIQNELIEDFNLFDDWMGKYEYLIELGKSLPVIDEKFKTDDHLIKGCQSRVWLHADIRDGILKFTADSDAIITKGLVSLMIKVLSGHSPEEIAKANLFFLDRIGLREHLSPTRSNGLLAMIRQMKMFGVAASAK